ncbi:hypothetical protein DEO72_LG5g766 [Vigna unguiculata]|uniref:Uncharacterized protein n=1 Tax=Vigna unguiculata TaxID=3917 RepID=A0A4D6LWF8_VIGUN|nr:hypothetical protein DEO72_LG5g766 [Vigna unguiculata]
MPAQLVASAGQPEVLKVRLGVRFPLATTHPPGMLQKSGSICWSARGVKGQVGGSIPTGNNPPSMNGRRRVMGWGTLGCSNLTASGARRGHDRANNDDEGQAQPQNVVHDHPVQGTNHSNGDFEDPPLHSNSKIIHQMWDGVQDLQNRMQGIEDMQGRVQRIEDNLSNWTLDMNRQMAEANFNVNLIFHKLDD